MNNPNFFAEYDQLLEPLNDSYYLHFLADVEQARIGAIERAPDLIGRLNLFLMHPSGRDEIAEKEKYLYYRGRLYDVRGYNDEAEEDLNRSCHLGYPRADAWIHYSVCLMKAYQREQISAYGPKHILEKALAEDKYPRNEVLLRLLSAAKIMLFKEYLAKDEYHKHILEQSVTHAHNTVNQDTRDAISWYQLGSAYFFSYTLTGRWDIDKIKKSEKAFKILVVDLYQENYKEALDNFRRAGAESEVACLNEIFCKIDRLLKNPIVNPHPSRKSTVDQLNDGCNETKVVTGKVLFLLVEDQKDKDQKNKDQKNNPLYYMVRDYAKTCFVITVYGVHSTAISNISGLVYVAPLHNALPVQISASGTSQMSSCEGKKSVL